MSPNSNQQGVALLLIVVIIGIVSVAALGAVVQSGLSSLAVNTTLKESQTAHLRLQACMDEAIGQFRHDADFAGTSVVVGANSCTATIVSSEDLRTVTLTTTEGNLVKTLEFTVDVSDYTITAYEER